MPHYSGPEHHRQSSVCGQTRLSSMFSSTSTWYIVIILPCINIAPRSDKPSNSPTRASLLFLNYQLKITSKDRMPTAVTCWQGRRRSQEIQILSLLFQFCCDFYYLCRLPCWQWLRQWISCYNYMLIQSYFRCLTPLTLSRVKLLHST